MSYKKFWTNILLKKNVLGLKWDVSKYSDVKSLVDVSVKKFGRIDFLNSNL
jgi:NAD(P)-dependent dehydrogenase (short-subunit alcohol dehydrogenase family)